MFNTFLSFFGDALKGVQESAMKVFPESSSDLLESQGVAAVVGGSTVTMGVLSVTSVLGAVATGAGIVLSVVLIVVQVRKFHLDKKKKTLEIALLEQELKNGNSS